MFWRRGRGATRGAPLQLFGRAIRPRGPDLSSIGRVDDELNPDDCLAKGEALLRAGHGEEGHRFLRQAPRLEPKRRKAAKLSIRAGAADFDFQRLIAQADQARDAAAWTKAAGLYNAALQLYPWHFGYMVQYGHCLKESSQFTSAECEYRSALALGAPASDVEEHLAFVAAQQGYTARFNKRQHGEIDDAESLNLPPTKADVELLTFVFLGRTPAVSETLNLLRDHSSLEGVINALIEDDAFCAANASWLASFEFEALLEKPPTVAMRR